MPEGSIVADHIWKRFRPDRRRRLMRDEIERFKGWPIVLDERISPQNLTPHANDVGALGKLFWIEISESGKGPLRHYSKLRPVWT